MPTKHGITIFLVPHSRKKTLSLKLSGWQVVVAAILFAGGIILFLLGIFFGGRAVKLYAENRSLRAENEKMRTERAKIVRLERELRETTRLRGWMEEQIGYTAGGEEPLTASAGGAGFRAVLDRPFRAQLLPELEDEAERVRRRRDFVPRGLPVSGSVTARFGEMGGKFLSPHSGVDIAAPAGTPVSAIAAGIVTATLNDPELGLLVEVDHLNGYVSSYGHLSVISRDEGDWVERGDRVGAVGETGHAEGPHVHYRLENRGELVDPLEPEEESKEEE